MRVKPKDPQETWLSPPQILQPATSIPPEVGSMVDKVNYLFHNTLHKPEWIGNYLWLSAYYYGHSLATRLYRCADWSFNGHGARWFIYHR